MHKTLSLALLICFAVSTSGCGYAVRLNVNTSILPLANAIEKISRPATSRCIGGNAVRTQETQVQSQSTLANGRTVQRTNLNQETQCRYIAPPFTEVFQLPDDAQ